MYRVVEEAGPVPPRRTGLTEALRALRAGQAIAIPYKNGKRPHIRKIIDSVGGKGRLVCRTRRDTGPTPELWVYCVEEPDS